MRIVFIGKFERLYDEEYIARSFEMLGHEVLRIPNETSMRALFDRIDEFKPHICLFTKFEPSEGGQRFLRSLRDRRIISVCWLFDLYFGYARQNMVAAATYFKADVVVTTDGGHAAEWHQRNIQHLCVRQGIYAPEAKVVPQIAAKYSHDVIFVGMDNPLNTERAAMLKKVAQHYGSRFKWFGRHNTHEIRGLALNDLFSRSKIVIGDSVWSPFYWSNRVVETLGRGGFLIHVDVPGIKQAYPNLVTYERNSFEDLKAKIDHYIEHEDERLALIEQNAKYVQAGCTMKDRCRELVDHLHRIYT